MSRHSAPAAGSRGLGAGEPACLPRGLSHCTLKLESILLVTSHYSYLILDLETGSKESYLRKGNPFDPKNKIVALGLKPQGEEAETYYLRDTNIINGFKFLQGNTCNVLVRHFQVS